MPGSADVPCASWNFPSDSSIRSSLCMYAQPDGASKSHAIEIDGWWYKTLLCLLSYLESLLYSLLSAPSPSSVLTRGLIVMIPFLSSFPNLLSINDC
ncbi:hypothetical protein KCU71_g69, partial [Aureobasidium melanogenum]